MKEFVSKWSNWWILNPKRKQLDDAFEKELNELIEREVALRITSGMRSCVHCGNTERFETWTELEYNDGSAEPHTAGNYLVNVEYVKCLDCGEVL